MGSRLTESVKLIEKAFRRKAKKERWLQTTPSFRNFKVDIEYAKNCTGLSIKVTDLLDVESKSKTSAIHDVARQGGTYIVTSIICPICNRPVSLNKHWNSYICECKEHPRMIFEICEVKVVNAVQEQTEG